MEQIHYPDMGVHETGPEPRTFRVTRSGAKDLEFAGYLLGQARREADLPGERSLLVSIYATVGGKYITHAERGADELPGGAPAEARAGVHDSADEAFACLLSYNKGKLGTVTKTAWEEACRTWPALRGMDVERVP